MVRFRPLTRADLPLVGSWLAAPHVARWWRERADPGAVEARYGPAIDGSDPTDVLVAMLGGTPVGLVQRYRMADEPDWAAALAPAGAPSDTFGIDYLIGNPAHCGRGLGTTMVDLLVAGSWDRYPTSTGCVVAVHADNRRSWRALERTGFRLLWEGELATDDPADAGAQRVYLRPRPAARGRRVHGPDLGRRPPAPDA